MAETLSGFDSYHIRRLGYLWSLFHNLFSKYHKDEISPSCIYNRLLLYIDNTDIFFLVAQFDESKQLFEYLHCSCPKNKKEEKISEVIERVNIDYKKFSEVEFFQKYPKLPKTDNERHDNQKEMIIFTIKDDDDFNFYDQSNRAIQRIIRYLNEFSSDKNEIFEKLRYSFIQYGVGSDNDRKIVPPTPFQDREKYSQDEIEKLIKPIRKSIDNLYNILEKTPILTARKDANDFFPEEEIPYRNIFFYLSTPTNKTLRGSDKKGFYDFEVRRIIPKKQAVAIDNYFFYGKENNKCRFHGKNGSCRYTYEKTPCGIKDAKDKYGSLQGIMETPFREGNSFTDKVFATGGVVFSEYNDENNNNLIVSTRSDSEEKKRERMRLDLSKCIFGQLHSSDRKNWNPRLIIIPIAIGGCAFGAVLFVTNSIVQSDGSTDDPEEREDKVYNNKYAFYHLARTDIVKHLERDILDAYIKNITQKIEEALKESTCLGEKGELYPHKKKPLQKFCEEVSQELKRITAVYPYDSVVLHPLDNNYILKEEYKNSHFSIDDYTYIRVELKPNNLFTKLTQKKYINEEIICQSIQKKISEIKLSNRKRKAFMANNSTPYTMNIN